MEREEDINPFASYIIHPPSDYLMANPSVATPNQENYTTRNEVENSLNGTNAIHQKLEPRRKGKQNVDAYSSMDGALTGYKLKLKYDGYFKPINKGTKKKYCLGRTKTVYLDSVSCRFSELKTEINALYHWEENIKLSMYFVDKNLNSQSFIKLKDDSSYQRMLQMYVEKKEVVIYVTTENVLCDTQNSDSLHTVDKEDRGVPNYEEGSDYCISEESYHSLYSTGDEGHIYSSDGEEDIGSDYEGEFYSYDKEKPVMEIGAQYPDALAFRRALNHYAIIQDFEYSTDKSDTQRFTERCAKSDCTWRIHASVADDGVTFMIKTLQPNHTCSGVNKSGNKHATRGWIADRIVNDLKSEGDTPPKVLKRRLERRFGIQIPYLRVWHGKELAKEEIYGKWDDSFIQVGAFKEVLMRANSDSFVDLETEPVALNEKCVQRMEPVGESQHFQRFFIALGSCIAGFLAGCRPYVSIDACHLKGKWKGVLAAATAIDGNSWMFPVAFVVLENESEKSWEWFLRSLHQAIGMPEGFVISSDMQKGLIAAVQTVYPLDEHRECMRHLFSNFKKHFGGDLFKFGLWAAARTYSPKRFQCIIDEISNACPAAITYLQAHHSKIWSRSQFGTTAKCDYLTNNIPETFNSWVSEARHKPVLDLLNSIRRKIMVRFHERRKIARSWKGPLVSKVDEHIKNISRGLGAYEVHRSMESCAEVERNGKVWSVNLDEKTCSCREWQVKGIPCGHAAALIASIRNAKWEDYVNPYFTVAYFEATYVIPITEILSRDEWPEFDLGYNMLPPIIKRPPGRPRKSRIKSSDEPKKKSNNCSRCGLKGHHKNTCKNSILQSYSEDLFEGQTTQGPRKIRGKKKMKYGSKMACTTGLFKLLQEEFY